MPMIGVIFFQWDLFSIMFLYWLENIVIGLFNVLKMSVVKNVYQISIANNLPDSSNIVIKFFQTFGKFLKWAYIMFFVFHYGIFTFVHGMFIFAVFYDHSSNISNMGYNWSTFISDSGIFNGIILSFLMLIVSHGISFRTNFIGKEEYKKIQFQKLIMEPYNRVIVTHLTIIIGAFIITGIGRSVLTSIILIIVKILIDLFTHNKEHIRIMNRDI